MSSISCAGCRSAVLSSQYLRCCLCRDYYDLMCANVSEKRFSNIMTKEHKAVWKCQACVSKAPKTDNTNTPVRSVKDSPDNVTIRRGTGASQSMSESLLGDCDLSTTLEQIRCIIREELHRILSERMHELIKQSVTEVANAVLSDSLNSLADKVAAMSKSLECLTKVDSSSMPTCSDKVVTTTAFPVSPPNGSNADVRGQGNSTQSLTDINDTVRGEGWSVVARRPPRNRNRPAMSLDSANRGPNNEQRRFRSPAGLLRGTAAPGSTDLEASERQRNFHIYYLKLGTTENQVKTHISKVTGCADCKIDTLKARGPYASFKVCVPSACSERLLAPDNWPENVCIKPWRRPFRQDQRNDSGA